jgi:hypothetical protein
MSGGAVWTAAAVSGVRQRCGTAAGCPDGTVHRGHCRGLRVSAATGSGRRAGVRWWDAATAAKPAVPDLLAEPLAELLAYVGHGRSLQR